LSYGDFTLKYLVKWGLVPALKTSNLFPVDRNSVRYGFLFYGYFQSVVKYEKIYPFDGSNE